MSNAIILNNSMPSDCLVKVVHMMNDPCTSRLSLSPQIDPKVTLKQILPEISQSSPVTPLDAYTFQSVGGVWRELITTVQPERGKICCE